MRQIPILYAVMSCGTRIVDDDISQLYVDKYTSYLIAKAGDGDSK